MTFFPVVLWNQFKYFFNMFFLALALSQFVPVLKVGKFLLCLVLGLMVGYIAPLVFVVSVTMMREAYDDIKRYFEDKKMNTILYQVLTNDDTFVDTES